LKSAGPHYRTKKEHRSKRRAMTLEQWPGKLYLTCLCIVFSELAFGFLAPAEAKENWILQHSPAMDAFTSIICREDFIPCVF
jgi:hypothetical protein